MQNLRSGANAGLQVDWLDFDKPILAYTKGRMNGPHLAEEMWKGSSERYSKDGCSRDSCGRLGIYPLYVPAGFSGGGAYMRIPAQAFDPAAAETDPGSQRRRRNLHPFQPPRAD
jgi:hypothetical protein